MRGGQECGSARSQMEIFFVQMVEAPPLGIAGMSARPDGATNSRYLYSCASVASPVQHTLTMSW
jgi:hypothetical protein